MPVVLVDSIIFDFAEGWQVSKYDEWRYYCNRFQAVPPGRKAVDLIAISPQRELFLIEAKDYRVNPRIKPSTLHEEVSHKVVDTLAALFPLSINNEYPIEQAFAAAALQCTRVRIILHLEQSAPGSRISPRKFKLEDIQAKMRQRLKAIDVRCMATDIAHMGRLNWQCR